MATATSGQGRRWSDKRGQEVGLGGRLLGTAVVTSAETHPGGSLTYCWDRLHPGTMSESGLCGYGSDIVHAIPSGGLAIMGRSPASFGERTAEFGKLYLWQRVYHCILYWRRLLVGFVGPRA